MTHPLEKGDAIEVSGAMTWINLFRLPLSYY